MSEKKHNPFHLKLMRGIDDAHIAALAEIRIKTTEQMLSAGRTSSDRKMLAEKTGIPASVIMELVKLSDLARLPGVKGIRARLYFDAGVDSVEAMARCETNALLKLTAAFVARTGFDGIPPLPKEVSSTIANAQQLPKVVEW